MSNKVFKQQFAEIVDKKNFNQFYSFLQLQNNFKISCKIKLVIPNKCQLFLLPYLKNPSVLSDSIPTRGVAMASATCPSNIRLPASALENCTT